MTVEMRIIGIIPESYFQIHCGLFHIAAKSPIMYLLPIRYAKGRQSCIFLSANLRDFLFGERLQIRFLSEFLLNLYRK